MITWARSLVIITLCVSLAGCGNGDDPISGAELAMRIESGNAPLILDVRTAEEYAEEHISGAINIDHTELSERLSELMPYKQQEIVVHCVSGKRAALAQSVLRDAGFADVRGLEGHMQEWTAGGYPVARTTGKPSLSDE